MMNVKAVFSRHKWLALVPIVGVLFYLPLFYVAQIKYGCGEGEYSMTEHLLCDLMEKVSHEGFVNGSRTIAIIGNTLLFIGMSVFFFLIPLVFKNQNRSVKWAQALGVFAMANFLFLFSDFHDQLVLISGVLGTVMVVLLIKEYLKQNDSPFSLYAVFCLVLSIFVFFIYQSKIGIDYLPAFQKTVFVLDGIWVTLSCYALLKMPKERLRV